MVAAEERKCCLHVRKGREACKLAGVSTVQAIHIREVSFIMWFLCPCFHSCINIYEVLAFVVFTTQWAISQGHSGVMIINSSLELDLEPNFLHTEVLFQRFFLKIVILGSFCAPK